MFKTLSSQQLDALAARIVVGYLKDSPDASKITIGELVSSLNIIEHQIRDGALLYISAGSENLRGHVLGQNNVILARDYNTSLPKIIQSLAISLIQD